MELVKRARKIAKRGSQFDSSERGQESWVEGCFSHLSLSL